MPDDTRFVRLAENRGTGDNMFRKGTSTLLLASDEPTPDQLWTYTHP